MAREPMTFDDKDRRFVEALIRHGVSAAQVARELEIDEKTLAKHFKQDIFTGRCRRMAAEANALFERARNGSARAAIKLEKLGRRPA